MLKTKGISLLAVLVASVILSVMAVSVLRSIEKSFRAQKHVSLRSDLESIKRMILDTTSCSLSLPSGSCTAGAQVELKRFGDTVLISKDTANPTKFGDYTIKADCNAGGDGIVVRAARLLPGRSIASTNKSDFIADPLTKQTATFAENGSLLFPVDVHLCRDNVRVKSFPTLAFSSLHALHNNCWCDGPSGPSTHGSGCPGGYGSGQTGGIWGSCWFVACNSAADVYCVNQGFESGVITQFNMPACQTRVTCFR